ncbi:MAG: insulinase family protein [Bacteroidia bacterium]
MKKIVYTALSLLFAFSLNAQVDRSKAPAPGPEPEFSLGTYNEFTMDNGMKVIVVENSKIPRITYQLRLDLPAIKEEEKAGYLSFAGDLLMAGTKNRTKDQIDEEVGFLGARMFTSYSFVYCSGLSRHKTELFDLMADVTLNPVFPDEELEKLKTQSLSALKANEEDPSSISGNVRRSIVYGKDHPYGEIETEATISSITANDCKDYYNQFFTPQAAYLVIVGDISLADAKKMANEKFGKWEGHKLVKGKINVPKVPSNTKVSFAHRTGAVQSVVSVTYPIERAPGDDDYVASSIMNSILGGSSFGARLMQNLREDKAFTYGCRSSLGSDEYVASFNASASVRNEVTDSAITEILFEMRKMVNEIATEDELKRVKSSLKGSFSRSLESAQTIASYALNTALYDLPEDYYTTYLQKVESVTLDDVKRAAEKFLRPENCHIVVVGDGVNVAPKLEKFGEVTFYDAYGFETEAPGFALPEGLTAKAVLDKALNAYGDAEAIKKMKSYSKEMEAQTPQGAIKIIDKVSIKKKMYLQTWLAGGNVLNETKLYNGAATMSQMGQSNEMDEDGVKRLTEGLSLYDEVGLLNKLDQLTLVGGEFFNGEKVVVVENNDNGNIEKLYYSLESGYLLGKSSSANNREITWTYSDYKDFDGVNYPSKTKNSVMPFEFEVLSIDVNAKIKKSLFK